jgi:hypothetical protein
MPLKVERVDTWAASIEDKPGGLAAKLNALTGAGVNLEFVVARRAPESKGVGVAFVTPIKGARQTRVAREVGFNKTRNLHTIRIEGPNKPGHGLNILEALGAAGVDLRGFTAAALGNRFVAHVAVESATDAAKAVRILRKM